MLMAAFTSAWPAKPQAVHTNRGWLSRAYALADIEPDLTRCRERAGPLLEDLADRVARDWLAP